MAQYIDKDALVMEIKRRIASLESIGSENYIHDNYPVQYAMLVTLKSLRFSIDTLEVKGVDLEKELDEWIKYGPHTNYPWCTIPDAIKITAEHFFELGMSISNKAQKGELYDCK